MKSFNKKVQASFTMESSFVMIISLAIIFLVIITAITLNEKATEFARERIRVEEKVSDEMTERTSDDIYVRAPDFLYGSRLIKDYVK